MGWDKWDKWDKRCTCVRFLLLFLFLFLFLFLLFLPAIVTGYHSSRDGREREEI